MSKKKMTRAVMSLKDFHGGSIPSDLPLPSAPGVTVERSSYERQGSGAWMSPSLGRGYGGNDRSVGYSRQGSGNGVRTYEDKASFFPNPANIGRNYDEDERKPMDGRPRSGHNDRYEDHGYEERPRSGYEKPVDRYSMDEQQGVYTPPSGSDRFGHPAEGVNYGPGDGQQQQQQQQQTVSAYATDALPPVSRNQSSYTQASQLNMQQRARPASPPGTWRQQSQQPPAATVGRSSGPNVWPARLDGEDRRMAEPIQNESRSAAPWRAQSTVTRGDEASVEKAPQGRWQSDSSRGDWQGPSHVLEVVKSVRGPVYTEPNTRGPVEFIPSPYAPLGAASDVGRAGYSAQSGQGNFSDSSRGGYADIGRSSYGDSGRGPYPDNSRRGFGDGYADAGGRATYQDSSRGFIDDGRRRINEERPMGYNEPLRSGNSERITFPDVGRTGYPDTVRYGGEPTRGVEYTDNGRREYRDSGRVEYVEAGRDREYTENSRGGYPDGGRGSQSRGYMERSRPNYMSERSTISEPPPGGAFSANGPSGNNSRSAYNSEGARDSHGPGGGRGGYMLESSSPSSYRQEVGYGADSNGESFGEDRGISTFGLESNKPFISNGPRSSPPTESDRGGYLPAEPIPTGGSVPVVRAEPAVERPRLKLLPRTKPLETVSPAATEVAAPEENEKELVVQAEERRPAEVLSLESTGMQGNDGDGPIPVDSNESAEDASRPAERPKLNLKPRSQPAESGADLDGSGNVRHTVFGGARPRELVLKERGVDEPAIAGADNVPMPPATIPGKSNRQEIVRSDISHTSWGDEKQEAPRRYEPRGARSMERLGPALIDRQDGNRTGADLPRGELERKDSRRYDQGDYDRQDNRGRYESNRPYDRQESRNRDMDREESSRPDIDKQESWRRAVSPPPAAPAPTLLDPSARPNSGRFGYTNTPSAVDLAQAFSRSSSIGSPLVGVTRTNTSNQRGPASPGIRGSGQGYGPSGYSPGSMNGNYGPNEAPFSRLAEAPPPVSYVPGGGYGNDRGSNGYSGGNKGGYGAGSGELNRMPSFGHDDFPGKRGLPLRRPYE